jgi:hypothetical protein
MGCCQRLTGTSCIPAWDDAYLDLNRSALIGRLTGWPATRRAQKACTGWSRRPLGGRRSGGCERDGAAGAGKRA